jgi:uncharacterized protein
MRIIVVSDTHGSADLLLAAVRQAGKTDMLLHLGDGQRDCAALVGAYDGEVHTVRGNCDYTGDVYERMLVPNGIVIYMTHGHLYDAKMTLNKLWFRGRECGADIVCFGHTHVPLLDRQGKLSLLNPGSLRHVRSYALIDIVGGKASVKLQKL